jgi:predicted nucleotidyltransferase
MLTIAEHFYKSLKVPGLKVEDVVFTGSCANYNYTPYSDLDIHLLIDTKKAAVECKEFKVELFDAKKDLWKSKYEDVEIHGYPVEVYVQDIHEKFPVAQGVYSLRHDKWLDEPTHEKPEIDKKEIKATTRDFEKEINDVVSNDEGRDKAKAIKDELKKTREKGLHSNGEFSDENIAFKELRNKGTIGKLMMYIKDKDVERMSLK